MSLWLPCGLLSCLAEPIAVTVTVTVLRSQPGGSIRYDVQALLHQYVVTVTVLLLFIGYHPMTDWSTPIPPPASFVTLPHVLV
jgi:hypothetical protein